MCEKERSKNCTHNMVMRVPYQRKQRMESHCGFVFSLPVKDLIPVECWVKTESLNDTNPGALLE